MIKHEDLRKKTGASLAWCEGFLRACTTILEDIQQDKLVEHKNGRN